MAPDETPFSLPFQSVAQPGDNFLKAAMTGAKAMLAEYNAAGQPYGAPSLENMRRWYSERSLRG